ncbi:putative autoregulator biosynthesis enzyme [Kitasatospora setae KM-6054]|uniref:Putative autoregulator biosynthesis enzyme n=1 Tax=Kitasatospora setae (strain ATCC 33774 / DSM 43861 / JCM 3304 / KCC A-0304 / NBRC 14216 / KM-6054) TaxID=452652 RepID=E4N424_KITSK|nr:putative autoregulator biosynthesis enzyme [Kitasatospora setae KM-6054]BAJ33323.1 putative autoregulator biosynthesis enzyme [Kitasatospora setae KM-6054]
MGGRRIVLSGATGFVGSVVLEGLVRGWAGAAGGGGVELRVVSRRPPVGGGGVVEWVWGDLAEPASLRGVCEGADVLVHLASYIGADEGMCEAVNVAGSAALVGEAVRAGVGRIVGLSTAAVYGVGPHSGIGVDEVEPVPVSVVSRTRLAGEGPVLAAGGIVLRPGLVLGEGDRWVVPALAELVERVPARWEGGRGLLSAVAVGDLGRLIVRLACASRAVGGGLYHASHPVPVRVGDLLAVLAAHGVLPSVAQREELSWEACLERLRARPGRVSARQLELLTRDHWYRSERVWRAAGCPAGPGVLARTAQAARWYRSHLDPRPTA